MFEINGLLQELARSKNAVYALNGLLLSFLAVSATQWTSFYMDQKYNTLLSSSQSSAPGRSAVGFNIDELISSHIFGAADSSTAPAQTNIPLSSLNLKLTGVIASDRGGFALISVNGQPQTPFYIGEVVFENALLDAVLPDRAILLRSGIKESLLLDADRSTESENFIGNKQSRSARTLPHSSIRKIGKNRFQVARSEVENNSANADILRQALIVPSPQGGFVVRNIQPGSIIEKLGLRAGDVIKKVNNLQINSMVDVMQLYRLTGDIHQIKNIKVEVSRNGNREMFHYNLR